MQRNDEGEIEPDPDHVFLTDQRSDNLVEQLPAGEAARWLMSEKIAVITKADDANAVSIAGPTTDDYRAQRIWTMTMRMDGLVEVLAEYRVLATHLLSNGQAWQRKAAQRAMGREAWGTKSATAESKSGGEPTKTR